MLLLITIILFLILAITISFYLVKLYKGKYTKLVISIITSLILFTVIFSLLFITVDIFVTEEFTKGNKNEEEVKEFFVPLWTTLFWLLYLLSYIFIPFYKSYEESDGFYFKEKAIKSIKENLIIYGIIFLVIIVISFYLMIADDKKIIDIIAIISSLANAVGILIVIILNGYGLVEIPRTFYKKSNYKIQLKYLLWKITIIENQLVNNNHSLLSLRKVVNYLVKEEDRNYILKNHSSKINKIWERINISENKDIFKDIEYTSNKDNEVSSFFDDLTYDSLLKLDTKSKRLINKRMKLLYNKQQISNKYSELIISKEEESEVISFLDKSSLYYKYYSIYNKYFRFIVNIILCIIFSILSLIIVFAEITLFYTDLNLNPIGLFLKTTDNYILFFIYITIPLVYFTVSTMFAFIKSRIKSYEVCKLNTDSISMLYLSGFMCFICFPL
jgi:hypothetical protein